MAKYDGASPGARSRRLPCLPIEQHRVSRVSAAPLPHVVSSRDNLTRSCACFGSICSFCERKGCSTPDGTITLVSDEVDEWHEYLKDKGMQFETGPPGTSPGFKHDYNDGPALNPRLNIYHFFVRDDRGQLVEVQQFRDPKWPKP